MEKKKNKIVEEQRLVTPLFRAAFVNLFKPTQVQGKGDAKYSIVMLFPKDSDMHPIKKAIRAAKIQAFGTNKDKWPEIASPVRDGDEPSKTGQVYEGFAGHWAVRATSNENSKPGVFDEDVQPITEVSQFYPGCYAVAYCFAYVWEYNGEHGVSFILDHVQKQRDGKPFGGKKPGQTVFKKVEREESDDFDADDGDSADADF